MSLFQGREWRPSDDSNLSFFLPRGAHAGFLRYRMKSGATTCIPLRLADLDDLRTLIVMIGRDVDVGRP